MNTKNEFQMKVYTKDLKTTTGYLTFEQRLARFESLNAKVQTYRALQRLLETVEPDHVTLIRKELRRLRNELQSWV